MPSQKITWKAKVISSSVLTIKQDTEKEDRQALIRAGWEATQPGRASKAKKAREKYLQQVKQRRWASHEGLSTPSGSSGGKTMCNIARPSSTTTDAPISPPPAIPARTVSVVDSDNQRMQRQQHEMQYANWLKQLELHRDQQRHQSEEKKLLLRVELENKRKQFLDLQTEHTRKRDSYNQKNFHSHAMNSNNSADTDNSLVGTEERLMTPSDMASPSSGATNTTKMKKISTKAKVTALLPPNSGVIE
jgi:hypothetical protein